MLDEADEIVEQELVAGPMGGSPPIRRGSRDERRDVTLRAFAAGQDAHCAYCGRQLPRLPPRGGRPTPYCPADPERYGQWGAKVITCAMLDENREIWVRVHGPDQPMSQVDVEVLDNRVTTLLAALDPVRTEVAAFQTRVGSETAAALAAKDSAEQARDEANDRARAAETDRDAALAEAEQARLRAALRTAEAIATKAAQDKDTAVAARRTAEQARDTAEADRQRALDQVSAAQDRIAELQTTLAAERATALDRLDRLRQQEDQARQDLRAALTEEHGRQLRDHTTDLTGQLTALRAAADLRVTELTDQLTKATHGYAGALGPLHDQLATARHDLTEQATTSASLRRQLDNLRAAIADTLTQTAENDALHRTLTAALKIT
jgi:chromosome segregation ATPase